MTNEERIYKLCECVMDLIDLLPFQSSYFAWLTDEIKSIREDIDNS